MSYLRVYTSNLPNVVSALRTTGALLTTCTPPLAGNAAGIMRVDSRSLEVCTPGDESRRFDWLVCGALPAGTHTSGI